MKWKVLRLFQLSLFKAKKAAFHLKQLLLERIALTRNVMHAHSSVRIILAVHPNYLWHSLATCGYAKYKKEVALQAITAFNNKITQMLSNIIT